MPAGEGATNVIPDNVALGGTVRSLSEEAYLLLIERVTEVNIISFLIPLALPYPSRVHRQLEHRMMISPNQSGPNV